MVKYWFLSGQGLLVGAKVICWAEPDTRFASHNQSCWHGAPKRKERREKNLCRSAGQNTIPSPHYSLLYRRGNKRKYERNVSLLSGAARANCTWRWVGGVAREWKWRCGEKRGERKRATMFYLNILRETTGSGNLLCYNSVPRSPPSAAITART